MIEYGKFIKQYKGKDYSKVPKSKLLQDGWEVGWKLDGNYVQVHKWNDNGVTRIKFFTSGGKEWHISELWQELHKIPYDFIIEGEFNGKGSTGKVLGDRDFSSTGHYVSETYKHNICSAPDTRIGIFDVLAIGDDNCITQGILRCNRNMVLKDIKNFIGNRISVVIFEDGLDLQTAIERGREVVNQGGEGVFIFHETHTIHDKGRSNLAIKIKGDKKTTMKCIGTLPSKTVEGENGSLILEDEEGRQQAFSGLSDILRTSSLEDVFGKIFPVSYERLNKDGVYVLGFINEKGIK